VCALIFLDQNLTMNILSEFYELVFYARWKVTLVFCFEFGIYILSGWILSLGKNCKCIYPLLICCMRVSCLIISHFHTWFCLLLSIFSMLWDCELLTSSLLLLTVVNVHHHGIFSVVHDYSVCVVLHSSFLSFIFSSFIYFLCCQHLFISSCLRSIIWLQDLGKTDNREDAP